jgi:hypothetical protein
MDGVSLNSFIASCLAERVGARSRETFVPMQAFGDSVSVLRGKAES